MLPSVEPGYLVNALPEDAPEHPEEWKDVLKDFNQNIMPGVSMEFNKQTNMHCLLKLRCVITPISIIKSLIK